MSRRTTWICGRKDVLKDALREFDGTVILVPNDREFLDGLVDKVYEFGNQKVVEHLGGIYEEFMQRKKWRVCVKAWRKKLNPLHPSVSINIRGAVYIFMILIMGTAGRNNDFATQYSIWAWTYRLRWWKIPLNVRCQHRLVRLTFRVHRIPVYIRSYPFHVKIW